MWGCSQSQLSANAGITTTNKTGAQAQKWVQSTTPKFIRKSICRETGNVKGAQQQSAKSSSSQGINKRLLKERRWARAEGWTVPGQQFTPGWRLGEGASQRHRVCVSGWGNLQHPQQPEGCATRGAQTPEMGRVSVTQPPRTKAAVHPTLCKGVGDIVLPCCYGRAFRDL